MVQYNRAHKLRSALAKSAASVCAWCVVQCAMCIVHSAMHTEAREGGPDSNCNSGPPLLQCAMCSVHGAWGMVHGAWFNIFLLRLMEPCCKSAASVCATAVICPFTTFYERQAQADTGAEMQ